MAQTRLSKKQFGGDVRLGTALQGGAPATWGRDATSIG